MERRIDRILAFLQSRSDQTGVTTSEVAKELGLQRTNVSKDLNELVREGSIAKLDGRPVRYTSQLDTVQADLPKHVISYKETELVTSAVNKPLPIADKANGEVFARIIGASGSMRNAVDQAKAAILYPPKGLNCLITGPTGSGKTFFAHAMFQFAQSQGVVPKEKELVVFNCADYANNPELLMSHLFGYTKGAFTGADQDKEGLIQKADGSMLFLDEIHRLPPEGQEMVFYFMDHGSYSRLGESGKNQTANVRIVGATTEDPHSALLETFVRRIPINIQMPSFNERPGNEKVELIKVLVAIESNRIQRTIILTEDVVRALLGSVTYGNVGQLKSNVQLICARGFMNHMNQEEILITIDDMNDGIKSGLIKLGANRQETSEVSQYLESKIIIRPNEIDSLHHTDSYELPYNLYDIIGDKAELLRAEGLDQEAINHFISTDINIHLRSFYKSHGFSFDSESKLIEFLDPRVVQMTEKIAEYVHEQLNYEIQQNFLYAMSLHISSFLKKINLGEERKTSESIREMATNYEKEFETAQVIRQMIAERFRVFIPESEAYYLTVLLVSLRNDQSDAEIGVIVAAHGESTASSMVKVVEQLLQAKNIRAVDMPLDMHPRTAYEKIREAVGQVDQGSGVLLLVDMGSLASFNEEIHRETGALIRTIDMVTTPLVVEAVRKASILGTDIDSLYDSLKGFQGYGQVKSAEPIKEERRKKAILAICSSGEGTAQRMKELLEVPLSKYPAVDLEIIPLSVADLKDIKNIQEQYQIIAATGVINPKINAPFITIERLISQGADMILNELLLENDLNEVADIQLTEENAKQICLDFMEDSYTFINPHKMITPLWHFALSVATAVKQEENYGLIINLVMHMAGVVERSVVNEPLTINPEQMAQWESMETSSDHKVVELAIATLQRQLRIEIPKVEEFFVLQLMHNQEEKMLH